MMELPYISTGIILTIISVAGLLENGFVIYVYARSTSLRDTSMKIILNLAVTDLCTALTLGIDGIILTTQVGNEGLLTSYAACMSVLMMIVYMIFVSQIVLWVTTLDRYIAICHQRRYGSVMVPKTVNILLILAWSCPVPIVLGSFLEFNNWNEINICSYQNLLHQWIYITFSSIIILFMLISSILYVKIMTQAWKFYRGFRPAQVQGINATSMRIRARQRAIKNGKAMAVITFAFIICWLPFHILQYQFHLKFSSSLSHVTWTFALGNLNCIMNPILYAWQKPDFRREARSLVKSCRFPHGRREGEGQGDISHHSARTGTYFDITSTQRQRMFETSSDENCLTVASSSDRHIMVEETFNKHNLLPRVDI